MMIGFRIDINWFDDGPLGFGVGAKALRGRRPRWVPRHLYLNLIIFGLHLAIARCSITKNLISPGYRRVYQYQEFDYTWLSPGVPLPRIRLHLAIARCSITNNLICTWLSPGVPLSRISFAPGHRQVFHQQQFGYIWCQSTIIEAAGRDVVLRHPGLFYFILFIFLHMHACASLIKKTNTTQTQNNKHKQQTQTQYKLQNLNIWLVPSTKLPRPTAEVRVARYDLRPALQYEYFWPAGKDLLELARYLWPASNDLLELTRYLWPAGKPTTWTLFFFLCVEIFWDCIYYWIVNLPYIWAIIIIICVCLVCLGIFLP